MAEDVLSVDAAVERLGFGRFHIVLSTLMGLYQMMESVEIVTLAYAAPEVQCKWNLNNWQLSMFTSSVLVGMMIGAPSLGFLADRYGRRYAILLSIILAAYFAALSAASPTFAWLITLRALAGLGAGGIASLNVNIFCEFTPTANRKLSFLILNSFWNLGALLATCLAFISFGIFQISWRWYLIISALPMFLLIPSFLWLPESPRQLLTAGKSAAAKEVLDRIARINGIEPLKYKLSSTPEPERGSLWKLLTHDWRFSVSVVIVCFLFIGSVFSFYSSTYLNTAPYLIQGECNPALKNSLFQRLRSRDCCHHTSKDDYLGSLVGFLGQTCSIVFNWILMTLSGRKFSLFFSMFVVSAVFGILNVCMSRITERLLLFILGMASMTTTNLIYLYSSELYPTAYRSIGTSLGHAVSRIGALLAPSFVYSLMPVNPRLALIVIAIVTALGSFSAFLLPIETKGRPLTQTFKEEDDAISMALHDENTNYDTFRKDDFDKDS